MIWRSPLASLTRTTARLAWRVPLFQSMATSQSFISTRASASAPSRAQTARRFQGSPAPSSLVWKKNEPAGKLQGDQIQKN
jgi:predicted dithiol-disulfide oxidoreductase (DUF899 family)